MIDHGIPDQQVVSSLRNLDIGVWTPPEKSEPKDNERLVSLRPIFRDARTAAIGVVPLELFMEDALESARSVSSYMFKLAEDKKREFEWQMEALARTVSEYRRL